MTLMWQDIYEKITEIQQVLKDIYFYNKKALPILKNMNKDLKEQVMLYFRKYRRKIMDTSI